MNITTETPTTATTGPDAATETTAEPSASPGGVTMALYGALLTGDLDQARQLAHDTVVLHVPGTHPLAGEHRGAEAIIRFVEATRARTDTGEHLDVLDVLEGKDHAAVYLRVTAERAGKAPLDNTTVHIVRLVDGRVAEVWMHNWDNITVNEFWS
jgi:ketosteroid isomerase-like protein